MEIKTRFLPLLSPIKCVRGEGVREINISLPDDSLDDPMNKLSGSNSLDLGFNSLNGSTPSSLRSLTQLSALILMENQFTGGIPDFLAEFGGLFELQLGGNSLGGVIPPSTGSLQSLVYHLNFSGNGLTGRVPLELAKLSLLQRLDISWNNLTGGLEPVGELLSLIEVNISYNRFNGPIPGSLMKLLNSYLSSFTGNPGLCVSCQSGIVGPCNVTISISRCDHVNSRGNGLNFE